MQPFKEMNNLNVSRESFFDGIRELLVRNVHRLNGSGCWLKYKVLKLSTRGNTAIKHLILECVMLDHIYVHCLYVYDVSTKEGSELSQPLTQISPPIKYKGMVLLV